MRTVNTPENVHCTWNYFNDAYVETCSLYNFGHLIGDDILLRNNLITGLFYFRHATPGPSGTRLLFQSPIRVKNYQLWDCELYKSVMNCYSGFNHEIFLGVTSFCGWSKSNQIGPDWQYCFASFFSIRSLELPKVEFYALPF